jgi:hypothetical protein
VNLVTKSQRESEMKFLIITMCLISTTNAFSKSSKPRRRCPKFSSNKQKALLINFDGLGASEFGIKILESAISKKIKKRCNSIEVKSVNFHYGKRGARAAYDCAKTLLKEHPSLSVNIFGHSYGGGKGVFNFLDNSVAESIVDVENAVTFDPRGYSYEYSNPGKPMVNNFVNLYQRKSLKGMVVKGADFEQDSTGNNVTHGNLPKTKGNLALSKLTNTLQCAN